MKINPVELRYWRETRVLTRAELADKAGISRSTYYPLERGSRPTAQAETVRKIAAALGVSPTKLVDVRKPADLVDVRLDHTGHTKVRPNLSADLRSG